MARRATNAGSADYSHLTDIHVVVRNFAHALAKDVTFDFSALIEDSDGYIISDLPYYRGGLHFQNLRVGLDQEDDLRHPIEG